MTLFNKACKFYVTPKITGVSPIYASINPLGKRWNKLQNLKQKFKEEEMEISSMGPVGLVALGIFLGAMLVWLGFCLVSDNHVKGDLVSKEIAFVPAGILGVAVCFYCIAPYAVKVEPVIFGSVLLAGILLAMMTSFRSWFKKPFSAR